MNGLQAQRVKQRTFSAESVGLQCYERLASARSLSIHSSFRGAINILTDQGIASLVPTHAGRGPLSVCLDQESFRELRVLFSEMPMAVADGKINLAGGLEIDFGCAEVYAPAPRFAQKVLPRNLVARNLEAARETSIVAGRFGGLGGLLFDLWGFGEVGHCLGSPYPRVALPAVRMLLDAARRSDLAKVWCSARMLAGLGIGLTPSGDDLLSGFMIASFLGSRNGCRNLDAATVNGQIVEALIGRTSSLSLEYVREAAFGRCNERVRNLVEALYTSDPPQVEEKACDVLSMGATSGTDLLVGLLLGVSLVTEVELPC